jgi:phosphoglycerate kinase
MEPKRDYLTLEDFELKNKTVLLRIDINSPIDPKTGAILDDRRMRSHIKTIKDLEAEDAKTVLLSHQSRPGKKDFTTMEEHAKRLRQLLKKEVKYVDDIFGSHSRNSIKAMKSGDIILLENVRFYSEEQIEQSPQEHAKTQLVRKLSSVVEIFLNDAFGTAHRSHASIVGFTAVLPSGAGRLMEKEIDTLNKVLERSESGGAVFVLGGAKVNDSIKVMRNALEKGCADEILVTGVVANVFLAAAGVNIGEKNFKFILDEGFEGEIENAKQLLSKYREKIVLPVDVALCKNNARVEVAIDQIPSEYPIWDIGFETIDRFKREIESAQVVVFNGPAGVNEVPDFALATNELLMACTRAKFAVLGGGHTSAAVEKLGIESKVAHVSTGGGACMDYLAGEKMPGIIALIEAAKRLR